MHGTVFDHTNNQVGYAKALGKPVLLLETGGADFVILFLHIAVLLA